MKIRILLEGCHDETLFDMEVTESEYELLNRVSHKANETSTYSCMPKMYVDAIEEGEIK